MATEIRNRPALATRLSLTAEPALEIAPGEALWLRCEVRNVSSASIVGATLLLLLPPEIDADDPRCAIMLDPLAPNAATTIVRATRVYPSVRDGVELRFEMLLLLSDGQLQRSEPATIAVCGRPCLNGPATRVNVELTDEPGVVAVSASIANAGTVPALDVIVDLPAPIGTQAFDGFEPGGYRWASLAAGASQTATYRARVVAPTLRHVRVSGASVSDRAGGRVALAPSSPLALHAAFTPPQIHAEPGRRRLQLTVTGTNAGPGCAHAAGFELRWPQGFMLRPHSLTWNGAPVLGSDCPDAFACARPSGDGAHLTIASIDAGESYELGCDFAAASAAESGIFSFTLSAADSELNAQARFALAPRTDIRLRLAQAPDRAAAGSGTTFDFEVINAGDADATLNLTMAGVDMQCVIDDAPVSAGDRLTIGSGRIQRVSAHVTVPADARQGDQLTAVVSACDAVAVLARLTATILVSEPRGRETRELFGATPSADSANVMLSGHASDANIVEPLDGLRLETWMHGFEGRAGSGLLRHLRGLHALLPNGTFGCDRARGARLAATSQALQLTIDRLAIASRLPDYRPIPDEITDADLCEATAALCATLATESEPARIAATRIAPARTGTTVLQALCVLLPTSSPECPAVSQALAGYVRSLKETFAQLAQDAQRAIPLDAIPCGTLDAAAEAFIVAFRRTRTAMNG